MEHAVVNHQSPPLSSGAKVPLQAVEQLPILTERRLAALVAAGLPHKNAARIFTEVLRVSDEAEAAALDSHCILHHALHDDLSLAWRAQRDQRGDGGL